MPTLRFSTGSAVTSSSPNQTRPPASGVSRPATMRKVVVLPQPEGPRIATFSPGWNSRSTGCRARVPSGNVLAHGFEPDGDAGHGAFPERFPGRGFLRRGVDTACSAISSGTIMKKKTSV